jgi:ribonuclease D
VQDTPLIMVTDTATLEQVCRELAKEPVLGVDTEADSMYSYTEKLCLIQVSDRNKDYIIDPLQVEDMSSFGDILENENIVKIFHGADYDVVSMKRDLGVQIRNIFDTMVSSQILGLPRVGLADLVNTFFGVKLDKKYQRYNWSLRPLLPEHLAYARGDSHFLLSLRELLTLKLSALGRLEIADEEFALLERREWTHRDFDPDDFIRIKNSSGIDEDGLRVLRKLFVYRDECAAKANRPPYKVIPNQVLLLLARKRPQKMSDLKGLVRAGSTMVKRHGPHMLKAIEDGLADESPLPDAKSRRKSNDDSVKAPFGGRDAERLFQKLKGWRAAKMSEGSLPGAMLASNSQLKVLAGWRPKTKEDLSELKDIRNWQVERYGEQWLAIIESFCQSSEPGKGRGTRRRRR